LAPTAPAVVNLVKEEGFGVVAFIPRNWTLDEAETYISFLTKYQGTRASNVPKTRRLSTNEYQDRKNDCEYWRYISSADHHYFISRILFLNGITLYSMLMWLPVH